MSEERKIEAFSAHRTRNGGWLIMIRDDRLDRVGTIAPEYAYSSDHDMLAALPGLIGAPERELDYDPDWIIEFAKKQRQSAKHGDVGGTDDPR